MLLLLTLLQDTATDFNDVGKLMLAGLAGAIVIAAALTMIRLKLRARRPAAPSVISITAVEKDRAR